MLNELQIRYALSSEQAAALKRLISEHLSAAIALSWSGGGDPEDVPLLQAEASYARLKLERFIAKLVKEGM